MDVHGYPWPRVMGHGPWPWGHGPWAMGHGPWVTQASVKMKGASRTYRPPVSLGIYIYIYIPSKVGGGVSSPSGRPPIMGNRFGLGHGHGVMGHGPWAIGHGP